MMMARPVFFLRTNLLFLTNSHALSGTTKNETLEKLEEWS